MAATTKGIPYPASTAPPNVPADLLALAQDLDFSKVQVLSAAAFNNATLLSAYPLGISVMVLAGADSAAGGWPTGATGHALTIKPSNDRAVQYFYRSSLTSGAFYRQLQNTPNTNTPWAGGSAAYAQQVGTVDLNAVTNPTASVQVNFLTGKFTRAPRVVVSSQTPSMNVAVQTTSATSATFIGRNVNTFTSTFTAFWIAMQALDSNSDG